MTVAQLRRLLDNCPAHLQVGLYRPEGQGRLYVELVEVGTQSVEHPPGRSWEFCRLVFFDDPDSPVR